jgi:plasmid stability protein
MKNVTISMDDELHQKVRVDAARAGMSMSRYIAEVLSTATSQVHRDNQDRLEADIARLRAVFAGPKLDLSQSGHMPSADERNARR